MIDSLSTVSSFYSTYRLTVEHDLNLIKKIDDVFRRSLGLRALVEGIIFIKTNNFVVISLK